VHSGYGQEPWRAAVAAAGLQCIAARSPAEGVYFNVPDHMDVDQVVDTLAELNLAVRRKTRFREMNRANKSRLQFKSEPFTVAPWTTSRPVLEPTSRFSGQSRIVGTMDDPGDNGHLGVDSNGLSFYNPIRHDGAYPMHDDMSEAPLAPLAPLECAVEGVLG
jgi:hypothetical protein